MPQRLEAAATPPLRVAALFFWGRSGTVFLHSLFDGHPEVLTFPATRVNSFHHRQWPDIAGAATREEMVAKFIRWNPSCFDGTKDRWFEGLADLGPTKDTPLFVDEERFTRALLARLPERSPGAIRRRDFFVAAHYAYAEARGEDVSKKKVLLYHLHSPEAYDGIGAALEDFPDMVAIGTVREPLRSLASYLRKNRELARLLGQDDRATYAGMVRTGGFNALYRHQLSGWSELFDRRAMRRYEVRLEDLHDSPRTTMTRLASWLGLAWDESLLASTWNGLAYWGDQMAVKRQNGFSGAHTRQSAEEKVEALDALDRYVLEGLLASWRREHGYDRARWHARVLAPLLMHAPTKAERAALVEAPIAAARSVVMRWGYTYRHLARAILPVAVRARLPLPAPISPGLKPPPSAGHGHGHAAPRRAA
jgi:Sulfotransferase family